MKTRKLFYLLMMLFVGVSFSACGGDDSDNDSGFGNQGGDSNNSVVQALMAKKWYGSEKEYNSYSYGYEEYTQTWAVYFLDENSGLMRWTATSRDSKLGTSRQSGDYEFKYRVNGNTITLYDGSNFVFTFYGDWMMQGETMFEAMSLTTDDYKYIREYKENKQKEEEEERKQAEEDEIKSNISRHVSCNVTNDFQFYVDGCAWNINANITSTLASVYPNKTLRYGIAYVVYNGLSNNDGDALVYDDTLESLMSVLGITFGEKYISGSSGNVSVSQNNPATRKLTTDELELLNDLKPYTKVRVFVEMDGKRWTVQDFDSRITVRNQSNPNFHEKTKAEMLLGTWMIEGDYADWDAYYIAKFNANGTCTIEQWYADDDDPDNFVKEATYNATYTLTETTLKMKASKVKGIECDIASPTGTTYYLQELTDAKLEAYEIYNGSKYYIYGSKR